MKYKIGDKVKIKTWERMIEEFGVYERDSYSIKTNIDFLYINKQEKIISELNNKSRILTIIRYGRYNNFDNYETKEYNEYKGQFNLVITNEMIECLA